MKKKHIQLLLVEDDPTDREAVKRFVAEENLPYELHIADSKKVFLEKMRERTYDMILLDYNLPDAKGIDLLQEIKGIPVIIITGSGNESIVLEAMHLGAADYLVKDLECNYLKLLPAAIGNIFKREEAEIALRESEVRYRSLLEGTRLIAWEFDPASERFTFVSGKAEEITGIPSEQWLEKGFWASHVHTADRQFATSYCSTATEKCEDHEFEYRFLTADGGFIWVRDIVHVVSENAKATKLRGVLIDISEQKKMAEEMQENMDRLKKFHNLAVDRELRMVELKQEVNELLEAAGKEKKYTIHQQE